MGRVCGLTIKRDIDVHSVLSVGDREVLNVLSFQVEEL